MQATATDEPRIEPFPADRVIGILIMVGAALLFLVSVLVFLFLATMFNIQRSALSSSPDLGLTPHAGMLASLVAIFLVVAGLQFTAGLGIIKSRRWGHYFAIAAIVMGFLQGVVGIVFSVVLAFYTILRMTGSLGPKPN